MLGNVSILIFLLYLSIISIVDFIILVREKGTSLRGVFYM